MSALKTKYLQQWKVLHNLFKVLDSKINFLFSLLTVKFTAISILIALDKIVFFNKITILIVLFIWIISFLLITILINPWFWGKKTHYYLNIYNFGENIIEDNLANLQKLIKQGKKWFLIKKYLFCITSFLVFISIISIIIGIMIKLI